MADNQEIFQTFMTLTEWTDLKYNLKLILINL